MKSVALISAHLGITLTLTLAFAQNVIWLPLGDSITFGCTGPTIQVNRRSSLTLTVNTAPQVLVRVTHLSGYRTATISAAATVSR